MERRVEALFFFSLLFSELSLHGLTEMGANILVDELRDRVGEGHVLRHETVSDGAKKGQLGPSILISSNCR